MRAPLPCLIVLTLIVPGLAQAQNKAAPKAPAGPEIRYFTSIDGLMDGNADVILKETRQGKAVTAAVLDVCYPAEKGSDRKDRFVANLTVSGQSMAGTTQSQVDKLPVNVKLTRKPTGDGFEFKGQIGIGPTNTDVVSTDNTDLSEKEFKDNQATEETVATTPKDFTEVSPEAVAVRLKLDTVVDFLKSMRGQNAQVSLTSMVAGCDALRSGEQTITLSLDPDRAPAFIARARTQPGVIAAGWTSGSIDMERALRFPASGWRTGDKIDRDKHAQAMSAVLAKTLSATPASSSWDDNTGKLTITLKRPSRLVPALDLTDAIAFSAIVSPDKPGGSDELMLWLDVPTTTTSDETQGSKLSLTEKTSGDEEGLPIDDGGAVAALAKEFKAQRWNADKSVWK